MTLRTRNRINIGISAFSALILALDITLAVLQILNGTFAVPLSGMAHDGKRFLLTKYNPDVVVISLYIQILYVTVTAYLIFRSFEKTQAPELIFISLFLASVLLESIRLWITLFHLAGTFSAFLIFCANINLFARIMTPLSLFMLAVMGTESQRQNAEQNIIITIIIVLMLCIAVPMNTVGITPNLSVKYGFGNVISASTVIMLLLAAATFSVTNRKKGFADSITAGFWLMSYGSVEIFDCTDILKAAVTFSALFIGTYIYIRGLHNQYMWAF